MGKASGQGGIGLIMILFLFETEGSLVAQAGLNKLYRWGMPLTSKSCSCLHLWGVGMGDGVGGVTSWLWMWYWVWTQSFLHARQVPYRWRHISVTLKSVPPRRLLVHRSLRERDLFRTEGKARHSFSWLLRKNGIWIQFVEQSWWALKQENLDFLEGPLARSSAQ